MIKKNASIAVVLLASAFLYNCSGMKDIEYTVNPNPLEMHGDKVNLNINGVFPEKGLPKKYSVDVTPTLVNDAGNELEFDSKSFQGEKAAGNGDVIPKAGAKFEYTSTRPYNSAFDNSDLIVKYVVKKGTKVKKEDKTEKIADALIVTPKWLQNDDKVVFGEDKLVRKFDKTEKATINYVKAKYDVRKSELEDTDIIAFEQFVTAAKSNPKIDLKGVNIMAYASPEGETDKNSTLSEDRANSAEAYLNKAMEKIGVTGVNINKQPKGEDWAGLKELIAQSNNEDKDIIIRVAEMNSDPAKREEEIKTLASTYKFLDDDIFPQLRRSQMTLSYVLNGYTDEELKSISSNSPQTLTVEELLFAANKLTNDLDPKLAIYKAAITKAPEDWRGYNNAGVILYTQGKMADARNMFEKANKLVKNPITNNNYATMLRRDGKIDEAAALFSSSTAAGPEVNYNLGLVNIKKGEYDQAVTNFGDYNTFNKALAQTLKKDYSGASTTLGKSADKESAKGYYLKAILAARKGVEADVFTNLKSAIDKDGSLKDSAKKDREFVKYFENPAFTALF